MKMKKIQIIELFGGIGSPRVALRNMGIPVKEMCIRDRHITRFITA